MKIRFGTDRRHNQCGACLRVFGGMSAFERHRRDFQCVDPAPVGLRISSRRVFETAAGPHRFDVWSRPAPPMGRAADGKGETDDFPETAGVDASADGPR